MKLIKLLTLSILAIVPIFGMEKEPLLFDKSMVGAKSGLLPKELHEELKKYLKHENRALLHKIFSAAMPKMLDPLFA